MKVISGGQTGVDRAALDAALAVGMKIGGWCPRGRRALDGRIPDEYPLVETPNRYYPERTAWNVRDSDMTLIVRKTTGALKGGTRLTAKLCAKHGKRWIDYWPELQLYGGGEEGLAFIAGELPSAGVLNVAGPSERSFPGIYRWARGELERLFAIVEGC